MIVKGNQRAGGRRLAAHLANGIDNDHVQVHELRGFASVNLLGAFLEIEAAAACTRCEQPFFSVSLNPPAAAPVHVDQFELAADAIEAKFPGLDRQPRAIVFHEKHGRRHAHCVWSRIDAAHRRAIPLPHSRRKLLDVSRLLYRTLGLEAPAGVIDPGRADPLNYDQAIWQQAKRLDEDPRDLKAIIRQAWAVSDNRASFEAALERQALFLARGDRRGFVVVHHTGEAMSLTRYAGMKKGEVEARLGKPAMLPTLDQVRDGLRQRMTATLARRLADLKEMHDRQRRPHQLRLVALRNDQRAARQALAGLHAARQRQEETARADRFRTGLMGMWDRVSGKRGRLSTLNHREAVAGRLRDRDEWEGLIDAQGIERRALQQDMATTRARHADERRFARAELAVMLNMVRPSYRAEIEDHAAEIEAATARPRDAFERERGEPEPS